MAERIAVFGGEGNMGKVVVREARQQGHEVLVVDPKAEVQIDPTQAIENSSVIYLSLFPRDILTVLDNHAKQIKKGQIVLDNSSVKTPIIPSLIRLDEEGTSVASTHPLAKHNQPLRGIKVLVMDVGINSSAARVFAEDFYSKSGMIVIKYDLGHHDEIMAPEQGLPHTLWRTLAKSLGRLGYDPRELWSLAPANAELFLLSFWRTVNQDPKISASIVNNFLRLPAGRLLLEAYIEDLTALIAMAEDETRLQESFGQAFAILNKDGMADEMDETTTIVIERLANLRLGSMVVVATEDKPGVLRDISRIFAECGINLTAIDSHVLKEGVKFMIGEDTQTENAALDQAKVRLAESGFKVLGIQKLQ